ncbi:MAG TPA: site-specific integrase, partial [Chloroflexota bacterium]|nr:site-specific integrase [Chloroflexota bacterium]
YERLWDFCWAEPFGLGREEAMATALFIQLVVFGEILAPTEAVRGLTWDDVELSDDGLLLSLALPNADGKLKVWVGAAELLLCRRLRAAGASSPFGRLRMDIVNPLLEWLFGRPVTLEELQRANRLAHLVTHPPDHIGYLTGKVSHKLLVEPDTETAGLVRHHSGPLFQPLESLLRQRSEKVTQHELERLVDAALPAWRGWSVDDRGALVPKLIIESLRLCCGTPMRNGRRSRSPSTVRALLHELCLLRAVLAERPIHQLTKADVDLALGGRRAESRLNSAIHWLARACRKQGIQPPRQFHLTEQRFFHPVELPRSADVYAVLDSYEPPKRPIVALVLMCCCVARKSEIGRLRIGDLLMDDHVLLIDVKAAKGGRPAQRRVRIPRALRPLIPAMSQHIQSRERESRLLQPLVARSSSTDAIFQRLSYRLAGRGIKWTPHMMRAIASTEARKAGGDPAQIGAALGHKLVATTVQHYIAFDLLDIKPSALALVDVLPGRLTTSSIAYVFGVSLRTAEGLRRVTDGALRLLAGSNVRHRAA